MLCQPQAFLNFDKNFPNFLSAKRFEAKDFNLSVYLVQIPFIFFFEL